MKASSMRLIRLLTAGLAAVGLAVSLAAISAAGAPRNALIVQALAAGLATGLALVVGWLWRRARWRLWVLMAACGLSLVLTLMNGVSLEGAKRWVALGPVQLHTASIALPFAAFAFARGFGDRRVAPIAALIALLLLYQHDAASSLAWALALAAAALVERPRQAIPWACVAIAGLLAYGAWVEPDTLPAVPYVEGLLDQTFAANPVLGVLAGLLMISLPAPFLLVARARPGRRAEALALAALWTGWIAGNLFGNYPAPVLGYGAAPILAWGLSLGLVLGNSVDQDPPAP
ncbi:FtsW/RodA/SpoVE family cell cycle protein [Caulobacter sp. SL161]|uniref:FtsW/RodA/SpoVE family cell cycle protein n=1 Tax=Caulobacter sp. SL161 TaxID=2995156 RepID=UPI00227245C0|nr:FtsW/RodA/SpoVE family cell cycle protein [Caulobacter sp. SL161]MCY1645543.1 FtsW/RodA/SpoVE family cell cycle protein [Caulobacter sp. SL161]